VCIERHLGAAAGEGRVEYAGQSGHDRARVDALGDEIQAHEVVANLLAVARTRAMMGRVEER